jgi:hypothetical protein
VELLVQGIRSGKAIRNGVSISQRFDGHLLDTLDADGPHATDVAPPAGTHHAMLSEADGLRLGAAADGVEEFALKEKHGLVATKLLDGERECPGSDPILRQWTGRS